MSVRLAVYPPDASGDELVMLLDTQSILGPPVWFSPAEAIKELTQVIEELKNR